MKSYDCGSVFVVQKDVETRLTIMACLLWDYIAFFDYAKQGNRHAVYPSN